MAAHLQVRRNPRQVYPQMAVLVFLPQLPELRWIEAVVEVVALTTELTVQTGEQEELAAVVRHPRLERLDRQERPILGEEAPVVELRLPQLSAPGAMVVLASLFCAP